MDWLLTMAVKSSIMEKYISAMALIRGLDIVSLQSPLLVY